MQNSVWIKPELIQLPIGETQKGESACDGEGTAPGTGLAPCS
jgi:hypothetical protein